MSGVTTPFQVSLVMNSRTCLLPSEVLVAFSASWKISSFSDQVPNPPFNDSLSVPSKVVPNIESPFESSAPLNVPSTMSWTTTDFAIQEEEPPVPTVSVKALSPPPPSISLLESHDKSITTSVQSITDTK